MFCNDGLFCTGQDTCSGGVCLHGGNPCLPAEVCNEALNRCTCQTDSQCDDGNPCTNDRCNSAGACVHTNNTAPCNDGLFCTRTDRCSNGVCIGIGSPCHSPYHPVCDEARDVCMCTSDEQCQRDSNPCMIDTCVLPEGYCVTVNSEDPCDDGRFCTFGETCGGQVCAGGSFSPCADGQHCDEENDTCVDCFIDSDCSDDNVCTTDVCMNNKCQHTNHSNPCNDGMVCTANDTCMDGVCVGLGVPDSDSDEDGVVDCFDRCLSSELPVNLCGCTMRGACCLPGDQGCVDGEASLSSVDCQSQGGLYQGDGSTCDGGCAFADGDNDGAIDLEDFARFHTCMQSDNPHDPGGKCIRFDVDHCGQIELYDFSFFQRVFTGE